MKRVRSRGEVEEVREERDAEKWRGQQSSEGATGRGGYLEAAGVTINYKNNGPHR